MIIGEARRVSSDSYKNDAMHSFAESFVNLTQGILNEMQQIYMLTQVELS